MPWRETSVMDERLRFVARLLEGDSMSDVCRSFGISRKTGYKIFNRYKDEGLEALTDRSRRPVRYANQLPEPVEAMIVRVWMPPVWQEDFLTAVRETRNSIGRVSGLLMWPD